MDHRAIGVVEPQAIGPYPTVVYNGANVGLGDHLGVYSLGVGVVGVPTNVSLASNELGACSSAELVGEVKLDTGPVACLVIILVKRVRA